ncbi:MAG: biopolymer transporter ExbD [Lentisphaeria bacterium]|jgi:biopolymer transport protein ExbD|nr:biopolymer transporter ExbD [Lentisphaeria bacterium]MDY0176383.1 biopolymer transporter ExbD [Lentisphaeria bacterium]NLZ59983.1 hypothetical protein [Lentisphaerota bacterium]
MQTQTHSLKKNPEVFPTIVGLISLFFILILMVMISNSVVFWTGTEVETSLALPLMHSAKLNTADKMIVTITRSGKIFFNDLSLDWHELERELGNHVHDSLGAQAKRQGSGGEQAEKNPPMIIVRADRNNSYETIARVMDLARSLGLNVYLAAEPPSSNPMGSYVPDAAKQ